MTQERAQYEADQLRISELEAENERLQAQVTEYATLLMDYEEKFDAIAENEGKRMIEFGEHILKEAMTSSFITGVPINIKKLYTNFKRK